MLLTLDAPLDLEATLDGGQAFRWRCAPAEEWWLGPFGRTVVRLRLVSRFEDAALEAQSAPEPIERVAPRLRRYLGLDVDYRRAQRTLSQDPHLARSITATPGLRLLRQDPWECLASFILSVQCHIPRIRRNVEALAYAAGEGMDAWGLTVHTFPSPEAVAALGEGRLRELGLGFRAPNLLATARMIAEGAMDLETLRSRPYEDARRELMALPGVGPKVADCVLAFSLDHGEAFPVDRWVLRGLRRLYLGEARITEEKAAAWARRRFGRGAAYAQQLLYHLERTRALGTQPLPGSRAIRAAMAQASREATAPPMPVHPPRS